MSEETRELIQLGKKFFEGRNYTRAEHYFLKVLRTGARYADLFNMLGVIYHIDGKFNDAIDAFEEALEVNQNYTEATLNLAVLYNDLGEYKKAKELYTKVKSKKSPYTIDPILRGKMANMHADLGDTYRSINRFEEAIDEYQKALKICPSFLDIRTKLAMSFRENNQRSEAIRELTQVVKQDPHYLNGLLQLGITYYAAGQKEKAAGAWKDILKKNKDHVLAQTYLRLCENGHATDLKKKLKK